MKNTYLSKFLLLFCWLFFSISLIGCTFKQGETDSPVDVDKNMDKSSADAVDNSADESMLAQDSDEASEEKDIRENIKEITNVEGITYLPIKTSEQSEFGAEDSEYSYDLENNVMDVKGRNRKSVIPTDINTYYIEQYVGVRFVLDTLSMVDMKKGFTINKEDSTAYYEYLHGDDHHIIINNDHGEYNTTEEIVLNDDYNIVYYKYDDEDTGYSSGVDFGYDEEGRLLYAIYSNCSPWSMYDEGYAYGQYFEYMKTAVGVKVNSREISIDLRHGKYDDDQLIYKCRIHLYNDYNDYMLADENETMMHEYMFYTDDNGIYKVTEESEGIITEEFEEIKDYRIHNGSQTDIRYDANQNPIEMKTQKYYNKTEIDMDAKTYVGGNTESSASEETITMEWESVDKLMN